MSINSLFIEKKRPRHPGGMPGLCFAWANIEEFRTVYVKVRGY